MARLSDISMPVIKYTITTGYNSIIYILRKIGQHRVDILDLRLKCRWLWGQPTQSSYYVMIFQIKSGMIKIKQDSKITGKFMTASTTPNQFIVVVHI